MDDTDHWHFAPDENGGGVLYTMDETGAVRDGISGRRTRHMITVHRSGPVTKEQADNLAGRLLSILNERDAD